MSIEKSTKDFRSTNYCTWLCSLITMMGFKARSGRPVTPGVGCTDTVAERTVWSDLYSTTPPLSICLIPSLLRTLCLLNLFQITYLESSALLLFNIPNHPPWICLSSPLCESCSCMSTAGVKGIFRAATAEWSPPRSFKVVK